MRGMIHIYTGDGKGKTTAALGLALRAAGHGMKIVIVQFLKGSDTGELFALAALPQIKVLRNSGDHGFYFAADESTRARIIEENNRNLCTAAELARRGECGMLILDEIAAAYGDNALDRAAADALITNKPETLELVLTGRGFPAHFLDTADYISYICSLRHPFDKGIGAREGIEY